MGAKITYVPPFKKQSGAITTRVPGNIKIDAQTVNGANAIGYQIEDVNDIVNSNAGATPDRFRFGVTHGGDVNFGITQDDNVLGLGVTARGAWMTSDGLSAALGGGRFGTGVVDLGVINPGMGFVAFGEYLSDNGIFLWYDSIVPGSVTMQFGNSDAVGVGTGTLPTWLMFGGQRRIMKTRSDIDQPTLELDNDGTNTTDIQGSDSAWLMNRYGGKKVALPTTDATVTGGYYVDVTVDSGNASAGSPLSVAADGNYDDAVATNANTVVAISLASGTGTKSVAFPGSLIRLNAWNWTPGGDIYVDASGGLSQTAPTTSGQYVKRVGIALNADVMHFLPTSVIELS